MSTSTTFDSLCVWCRTFETDDGTPFEPSELTSGVYLHNQVCASLAPNVFSLDAVNTDPGTNWMVRRNNLKKIANGIRMYIETILNSEDNGVPDVEDFLSEIDLGTIAKDTECTQDEAREELTKLLSLILSACVHGTNQESYVQTIMGLDENIQEELMHSIHAMADLFTVSGSPPPSPLASPKARQSSNSFDERPSPRNSFDLNDDRSTSPPSPSNYASSSVSSPPTNSSSSSSSYKLAEQLDELKKYNQTLEGEKEEALRQLKRVEMKNKKYEELNKHAEATSDTTRQQTLKLEKDRDKAMAHVSELEEKMENLVDELGNLRRSTSEKNKMLSSQLREQADELELSREQSVENNKMTLALSKAKKKLEELPSLKRQLKECEERCDEYMEKTIDQENMLDSLPLLKKKINDGKDKIGKNAGVLWCGVCVVFDCLPWHCIDHLYEYNICVVCIFPVDLHGSIVKLEAKLNSKEKEVVMYKSKTLDAVNRSRSVESELATMKDEIECLKLDQSSAMMNNDGAEEEEGEEEERRRRSSNGLGSELLQSGESKTQHRRDMIEKIARLERENNKLRNSGGGGGGGGENAGSDEQLEDEIRLKNRYQQDSREANAKVEALTLELNMLKEQQGTTTGGDNNVNTAEVEKKMKKYELDLKNTTNKYNRLKNKNDEERSKYATLKHSMIEMEQKMGDLLEEQKSKDNEVSSSDEANEIILKKIKKALRSKEEQCDQLAMDKSKLEKYVQKALQTVHGKYKEACSKLQTKLDATEVKLKESDAKVRCLLLFLFVVFVVRWLTIVIFSV